ncbi:probable GTPase/general translation initiation factor eIF2 [Sporisorium scitamineum]|uniref:Eukaryotic translation initiation factor 5B n=1 Tax=Sporisorium scitamineum TaxID=49012 RepID=A0A127ZGC6_9BASI|nr:probable GTPase/general translation initiation factor eIF2 [Sporisorium scitamineum]
MGKKKGAKKGGADDFWDEAGESIDNHNNAAAANADDDEYEASTKKTKNLFAAMLLDDGADDQDDEEEDEEPAAPAKKDNKKATNSKAAASKPTPAPAPADDDDDDDNYGLMGAIKTASKKGKKDKKKKKKNDDFDFDEFGEDVSGNAAAPADADAEQDLASKAPVQGNIDDMLDDEFPDDKPKKKGGAQKQQDQKPDDADADDAEDDGAPRILTKKEKEKLKKEKEKAKKKAQAAAKKTASASQPAKQDAADDDANDDAAEQDDAAAPVAATSASDKKKKKKGKGAEPALIPAPAPSAAPKKMNPQLAALQARIAAQRKAEEEAEQARLEAIRAEEERERLEKEEEERKEAAKKAKKEREKAKKEQLKKEGKFLTPKQKAEKAAAEARMQAMIQAGHIKVEGLENREAAAKPGAKKRTVIDNRKKDGGLTIPEPVAADDEAEDKKQDKPAEAAPAEKEVAPEAAKPDEPAAEEEDVKDSWDAESENEDVKDDWDAESEDEKPAAPASKGIAKADAAAAPAKTNSKDAAKGKQEAEEEDDDQGDEDDDDDDESDSDDDDSDSESEDDDGLTSAQRQAAEKKAAAAERRKERTEQAMAARSRDDLRSPICCILGHVDTGKTKLLDKIRQTNVQEGEAGGITQQIGATYFPTEVLQAKTAVLDKDSPFEYKVPGLLVIDTPGHESFTNLRTRGSSLCNIAILVVDIMHGLEQQTIESIRLLRDKKTPFIVALNKIDRLYGWEPIPNNAFRDSLSKQQRATRNEFEERTNQVIVQFAEQGLNAVPYYDNKNMGRNVSLVPTSAHTGEGIPDMLRLIIELTQTRMSEKLMYLSELECTVLEVKVIEGLGTTIDVVLSNGVMHEGDRIVVCGLNGPIVTQVRALLTPQPLKEMRVKGAYVHHKMVKAALGVKIAAPDLEKAIAGSRLLVVGPDDDEEDLKDEVMSDLSSLMNSIDTSGRGVCVQASTLGSLEALLEFLRVSKIPVNGINIGPVFKKDVVRCSTMLEKAKELAVILAFDVPVDKEAEKLAEELGIKIFTAKIIYHLENDFTKYHQEVMDGKKKEASGTAVWPCRLKTIACFAKRDPIILGCDIIDGSLRVGTPLCVVKTDPVTRKKTVVHLGKVTSLEINHKERDVVLKKDVGGGVAVKIEHAVHESAKMYGRHFEESDVIISHISRASIDALKAHFWDGISTDEKKLIKKLKGELDIP